MLIFKKIDCILQAVLIVLGVCVSASAHDLLDEAFFFGYFLVGGWQLLSVFVHFFYRAPYTITLRKIYLALLGFVLVGLVFSLPLQGILIALTVLLFLSPLMAIYYLVTCLLETQKLKQLQ